jgi:hypothetical protein
MPLELNKLIMNIIFWKTNWDFGADARGIAEITNLSLGNRYQKKSIYQASMIFSAIKTFGWTVQRLEFSVRPAVGVRVRWSNWFLVGVHPKNIYCVDNNYLPRTIFFSVYTSLSTQAFDNLEAFLKPKFEKSKTRIKNLMRKSGA